MVCGGGVEMKRNDRTRKHEYYVGKVKRVPGNGRQEGIKTHLGGDTTEEGIIIQAASGSSCYVQCERSGIAFL